MLVFPLKKQWYDKIKSGEKTIEYREVKPYWTKRLKKEFSFMNSNEYGNPFDVMEIGDWVHCSLCSVACKLRLGYTNKCMIAKITKVAIVDGNNTDLHIDKPAYAIHLKDVREL